MKHAGLVHAPLARLALALVLAGTLAACELVPRTRIEGEDDGVLFPTGRLSWELDPTEADAGASDDSGSPAPVVRGAIELDAGYGSGEFTQHLEDGQIVQVGGTPFTGPGPVEVSAELWTADLAARAEWHWPSGLGLGGRFGLRYTDLDLTLRSSPAYLDAQEDLQLSSLGLLGGLEGSYEPTERLRLYLAGSLSWGLELSGLASGYEDHTTRTLEAGLAWTLGEHLRLLGGWRRVRYETVAIEDFLSDLDLTLSGPFLGLWVTL